MGSRTPSILMLPLHVSCGLGMYFCLILGRVTDTCFLCIFLATEELFWKSFKIKQFSSVWLISKHGSLTSLFLVLVPEILAEKVDSWIEGYLKMIPLVQNVSFKRTDATKCCVASIWFKHSYMSSRLLGSHSTAGLWFLSTPWNSLQPGYRTKLQMPTWKRTHTKAFALSASE